MNNKVRLILLAAIFIVYMTGIGSGTYEGLGLSCIVTFIILALWLGFEWDSEVKP